jgi:hypothetical protein
MYSSLYRLKRQQQKEKDCKTQTGYRKVSKLYLNNIEMHLPLSERLYRTKLTVKVFPFDILQKKLFS